MEHVIYSDYPPQISCSLANDSLSLPLHKVHNFPSECNSELYVLLFLINYQFNTGQYWESQLEVNSSFPNLK